MQILGHILQSILGDRARVYLLATQTSVPHIAASLLAATTPRHHFQEAPRPAAQQDSSHQQGSCHQGGEAPCTAVEGERCAP